ncbi:hypothetical protein [Vibrio ziniensis]|uniref:Uncharacterized protein n=1 Tax=Vibrio ziniensis TaxID=2711221 RepID=A0A6G7CLE2_9VIBR|nr:hypothetical protein [Vibrio ziniensis]QIH42863.1 hypothetical protein G5S32_13190 [Vibrio ziniensis]
MELSILKLETPQFVTEMEAVLLLADNHRAKHFLCSAFCSYYRSSYEQRVDLTQMDFVDSKYKMLFINLVLHRHKGFYGDEELYELFAKCKAFLDSFKLGGKEAY